ncbi:hypothetical protein [Frankia sp. R43]|uniref:hypothetical protein n=1 Tax=Frankia sp. R43 TaxID=269536 RepID=UPI0006C9E84C|nr:hypothetical protein [Frankia sp. R43]
MVVHLGSRLASAIGVVGWTQERGGRRFLGYLDSQLEAAHALRLGLQGVEPLLTGRLVRPMESPDREMVLAVRRGDVAKDAARAVIVNTRERLAELLDSPRTAELSPLRSAPDLSTSDDAWSHHEVHTSQLVTGVDRLTARADMSTSAHLGRMSVQFPSRLDCHPPIPSPNEGRAKWVESPR